LTKPWGGKEGDMGKNKAISNKKKVYAKKSAYFLDAHQNVYIRVL
jgi:hypothetical protein